MHKLKEVAERLQCGLSNVYALVESGELVATATGANGKGYRVSEAALAEFLDRRRKDRGPHAQVSQSPGMTDLQHASLRQPEPDTDE